MKNNFFYFFNEVYDFINIIIAIALAFGTFVENDFGRSSAKALIYNTWWFELMLALFVYNLFNNLIKYRLFRHEKLPVLIFI